MKLEEAMEILASIEAAYPRFELTEDRVAVWAKQLLKMDFEPVQRNLDNHILESKYIPTIAEIAHYPTPKNEFLEKWKQWEAEGAKRIAEQQGKPKPRNPFK